MCLACPINERLERNWHVKRFLVGRMSDEAGRKRRPGRARSYDAFALQTE